MGELGCKYTTAEMAESFSASRTHVSKVASRLVELGFLDAVKGRNGGICLRDLAADKSVGKLLYTLESDEVVDCVDIGYPLPPTHLLRGRLAAVQEVLLIAPSSVLVVDLIPIKPADGADGDTPEGDSVPRGSMFSIRPV